jgi:hypothetical protein
MTKVFGKMAVDVSADGVGGSSSINDDLCACLGVSSAGEQG